MIGLENLQTHALQIGSKLDEKDKQDTMNHSNFQLCNQFPTQQRKFSPY